MTEFLQVFIKTIYQTNDRAADIVLVIHPFSYALGDNCQKISQLEEHKRSSSLTALLLVTITLPMTIVLGQEERQELL